MSCIVRVSALGLVCAAAAACAAKPLPFVAPVVEPRRHRPHWLRAISRDVDAMARCLALRESPAFVLMVAHATSGITGFTTVDAHQVLEHCMVDEGRVVMREPDESLLSDYEGLPLFSLGSQRPSLPPGQVAEEVISAGEVLGWLHWLAQDEPAADSAAAGPPEFEEGGS